MDDESTSENEVVEVRLEGKEAAAVTAVLGGMAIVAGTVLWLITLILVGDPVRTWTWWSSMVGNATLLGAACAVLAFTSGRRRA